VRLATKIFLALLFSLPGALNAQSGSILGQWEDPGGSVVSIGRCDNGVCIWVDALSPSAPASTDIHNPDPKQKRRPLCGLKIGSDFHMADAQHADGGALYDPKSGNTYHGEMKIVAGELHLRGYIGFSIFGRTEVWKRTDKPVTSCASAAVTLSAHPSSP